MNKLLIIFSLFLMIHFCDAQITITTAPENNPPQDNSDAKLAKYYYDQKEYDKALSYLVPLYEKNSSLWYNTYFNTLLNLKEYSKAEKITKQQLKKSKEKSNFYVNLGKVYGLQGTTNKQNEAFEKAIKELELISPYIENLAQAFLEIKEFDFAIKVYDKVKNSKANYTFYYNKAEIYKLKNDLRAMINEYLDALDFRDSELQAVQANLQNSLGYDDEKGGFKNPILKEELQKRIVKNPYKIVFLEFLIFIQKQQKDFYGAMINSKSIDKRQKENGFRIYELAKICYENKDWETAHQCLDYLLSKGNNNMYYEIAKIEGLHVTFLALTEKAVPDKNELLQLETNLKAAYTAYFNNSFLPQILKDLIQVQTYYLNKANDAQELLQTFIELQGIDPMIKAEFKIYLADILLIQGSIWDASLLYSQVEKDFKYESIGNEAKFKNAKLSFYAGDFSWAKLQVDVLKGATSKLISNDAIDLSLVISDAIGVDTNEVPLKMFASAELLFLQHQYPQAFQRLDSINLLFNNHTLVDDIYFKKAENYRKLGQFKEAEANYKNVIEYFSTEIYGDDAQFKLAELYERELNDKPKAMQAYEQVLLNYPGSTYAIEARSRYRKLRGDNISN